MRKKIDEVVSTLDLEQELCDLYVEGKTDKRFMDWYLSRKKIKHVNVYSIDVVEIPNTLLQHYNLPIDSNRSRVIALSREIAQQSTNKLRVLCVADRDWEDYCPCQCNNDYLVFTDGNSLELYALTPTVFHKFSLIALGGFTMSEDSLIGKMRTVLEQLYVLRLTNEHLKWGMKWIPPCSYLRFANGEIYFRENEFIQAYLQNNNKWNQRQVFSNTLQETRKKLISDNTRRIRGHDISDILLLFLRRHQKERKFGNSETLEGCLMATIDTADLDQTPLFKRILDFAKGAGE